MVEKELESFFFFLESFFSRPLGRSLVRYFTLLITSLKYQYDASFILETITRYIWDNSSETIRVKNHCLIKLNKIARRSAVRPGAHFVWEESKSCEKKFKYSFRVCVRASVLLAIFARSLDTENWREGWKKCTSVRPSVRPSVRKKKHSGLILHSFLYTFLLFICALF